jgi:peptide chain release factor 1
MRTLAARLDEIEREAAAAAANTERAAQVGSGMRGDKIRTYRERDNIVIDHRTERKLQLDRWLKGEWS